MTPAAAGLEALGASDGETAAEARLYLCPTGLVAGPAAEALCAAGLARPLAGGDGPARLAWTACEVWRRGPDDGTLASAVAGLAELEPWVAALPAAPRERLALWLERSARAKPIPGLDGDPGPALMGIVNVTPDSFSDGGEALDPAAALARIEALAAAGARIVDVGAVSTRPGAEPVAEAEELRRLQPVLAAVAASELAARVALSIDSSRASAMAAALDAGFALVNDVTALTADPAALPLVAERGAGAVLMHGVGGAAGAPAHAALDACDALEARIAACEAAGLPRARLIVDPGIAFAKGGAENLAILRHLALLQGLGCPVLLGASRKGLTGEHHRRYRPAERLPGSLVAALQALDRGVQLLRVHDVVETRQAVEIWRGLAALEGEALVGRDGHADIQGVT